MPRIEHIRLIRSRPERFVLTLEDGTEIVVAPETMVRFGISLHQELEEETFLQMLREDEVQRAKDQALRFLERRAHSERELKRKLLQKGYREPAISEAIAALRQVGLVDDAEFARQFVENEMLLRPVGRLLLQQKLRERGVPDEILEPLMDRVYRAHSEVEIARELARKYRKRHGNWKPSKLRAGLVRFLQSKGFDWEVIQDVLVEEPD
ncbi:MAG: regulatory protein RecX [Calditrichaeota bacterium]|nr:regulatory protein RecX [Calditrichota bacterium]